MSFQYPVEIAGITTGYFVRSAMNAIRRHRGEEEVDAFDFLTLAKDNMKLVSMDEKFMNRSVNEGFSGGEKKRNEIFQMAMLEPKLAILDETDSGLDIDALRIVSEGVNTIRDTDGGMGILLITHYKRILNYLKPDYVHVMLNGQIAHSGGSELADRLEEMGYDWLHEEPETATVG
jgi:Fe-S cluster assembly ATP-binding protein